MLTLESLQARLDRDFGGVLSEGSHDCGDGAVCARELRALELGQRLNDHPDGVFSVTDRVVQVLNDADWSSPAARTRHCLPLALLCEQDAAPRWVRRYAEATLSEILPMILDAAGSRGLQAVHSARARADIISARLSAGTADALALAGTAAHLVADVADDAILAAGAALLVRCHRGGADCSTGGIPC